MGSRLYSFSQLTGNRHTVEIEGRDYEILSVEDLGSFQKAQAAYFYEEMDKLKNANQVSRETLEAAGEGFDEFILMFVKGLKRETLDNLTGAEKDKLFELFTKAVPAGTPKVIQPGPQLRKRNRTTAK